MAWTSSNPVVVGNPTKKSEYDTLWDNATYLKYATHVLDQTAFDAMASIAAAAQVIIAPGTYTVSADMEIPDYVSLYVPKGVTITIATGKTLTISGQMTAGLYSIFNCVGTGTVTFGDSIEEVYPEWWYTGTGSWHTAINTAAASILSGVVKLSKDTYSTDDMILINTDRIILRGSGRYATQINFVPTDHDVSAIRFKKTAAETIVQCGIEDLQIYSTDETYRKIALELVDISEFSYRDVAINGSSYFTDSSYSCVGILIKGRDTSSFINPHVAADIPIQVSENPNHAYLDFDVMNFHNLYTIATSTNPNFKLDTGVNLWNISFTGSNVFCLGGYGFYWSDTTSTMDCFSLLVQNLRWEQSTNANGYFFYISRNTGCELRNVTLMNCYCGSGNNHKGFYFRSVGNLNLINCAFHGTSDALNIDDTVYPVTLDNFYYEPGSTISTGTLVCLQLVKHFGSGSYPEIIRGAYSNYNYINNYLTLEVNSATPDVTDGFLFVTANTNATTITNFAGWQIGKKITIIFNDANTTIDGTGTNILLYGGGDFSPVAGDIMECIFDGVAGNYWKCRVVYAPA
jgi:hypothetical protein